MRHKKIRKADIRPTVTLIIAAYNEEVAIREKIENSLVLEYDKNKLEIIVASDCSTDKTDEIVRDYRNHGVRLVRLSERGGKTAVQNLAVKEAKGEILVFSDATTSYRTDTIQKIARFFADESVGCVGGKLLFKRKKGIIFGGEKNVIEEYDQYIKQRESEIQTIFGVNGCLYAVRKHLYESLSNNLTSDFVLPLKIIEKGYRVIYEPEALSFEEPCANARAEFKRKIRTVRAGITGLVNMRSLLNPFKRPFIFWGLVSHKLLRWLVPYFLLLAFGANLTLLGENDFYKGCLIFQILIYAFTLTGYFLEKTRYKVKIFPITFNFMMLNLAAIYGFVEFLKGNRGEI